MKRFHVQIQPARSSGWDSDAAVDLLRALGEARVVRGEDAGPYINVDFRPVDLRELWHAVRERLRADPSLSTCAIVCCEGDYGWDDYLLLHHFDPSEPLDELG